MSSKEIATAEGCTNCGAIGRRQFLGATFVAAAAAALAACAGGGGGDSITAPSNVSLTLKVSDYSSLSAIGGVALVSASGSPIAVVKTGAQSFVALSRICPHQGSTVNVTSSGFLCPNHGAQFSSTGTWKGGQNTSNMRSYTTNYVAATDILTIG